MATTHGVREATADGVTVRVEDSESCPRYVAIVVRGVQVGPSPSWLVQRLDGIGQRIISNIVDATNYILHGLGQPVHAFDLNTLQDRTVVVRPVRVDESLVDRKSVV